MPLIPYTELILDPLQNTCVYVHDKQLRKSQSLLPKLGTDPEKVWREVSCLYKLLVLMHAAVNASLGILILYALYNDGIMLNILINKTCILCM